MHIGETYTKAIESYGTSTDRYGYAGDRYGYAGDKYAYADIDRSVYIPSESVHIPSDVPIGTAAPAAKPSPAPAPIGIIEMNDKQNKLMEQILAKLSGGKQTGGYNDTHILSNRANFMKKYSELQNVLEEMLPKISLIKSNDLEKRRYRDTLARLSNEKQTALTVFLKSVDQTAESLRNKADIDLSGALKDARDILNIN